MIKTLVYVSWGNIPSRFAHSVQMAKMAGAFAELVRRVELVTQTSLSDLRWGEKQDIAALYGLPPSLKIRRLPVRRWPICDQDGFFDHPDHPRFDRLAGWYCRLRSPDLVYTRSWRVAATTTRLRVPTALEDHANPCDPSGAFVHDLLHVLKRRALKGLITISPVLKEAYAGLGMPNDRILVAPCAVDVEAFEEAAREAASNSPVAGFRVGYCGHLYEHRGIDTLLACARLLPDVRFELVGGHPRDVERWRREASGVANVAWIGFVPPSEVPRRLVGYDVLCMPYSPRCTTSGWMSPMKMFEYMAAGRAIVASDLPATRAVLQHETNALLCPPDSAEGLAAAVQRLRADEGLRERLGTRARSDAKTHTWRARAERILAWLEEHRG